MMTANEKMTLIHIAAEMTKQHIAVNPQYIHPKQFFGEFLDLLIARHENMPGNNDQGEYVERAA